MNDAVAAGRWLPAWATAFAKPLQSKVPLVAESAL